MNDITALIATMKAAAEKATPGRIGDRIDGSGSIKYECLGYDGSLVLRTDHKNMEYGFVGDNGTADEEFFRACVPDNILALVEALEAGDTENERMARDLISRNGEIEGLRKRVEELEEIATDYGMKFQRAQDDLKKMALMHRDESRTVTVKLPADSADSDVSSRNQPGMVVAVHIDAGDFVKVKGQVFEVEETDFDDHDVTLWFVGGDVLRCAAGCQVEVVAAPDTAGIQVIEGAQTE